MISQLLEYTINKIYSYKNILTSLLYNISLLMYKDFIPR